MNFKDFLNENYKFEKVKFSELNETEFKNIDVSKHDYIEQYIELAKKGPINFFDGSSYQLQKEDIEKLEYLKKLKNKGALEKEIGDWLKAKDENNVINNRLSNGKNTITGVNGFDKSMVSQGNKGNRANIDDERESAVAVIFDMLVQESVQEENVLEKLAGWKPNGEFKPEITQNGCESIRAFLSEKNNLKDSYQCALGVKGVFDNTIKSGNYKIYHKSKAFSYIKETAKKILSEGGIKCQVDKWNPADIFIIRDNFSIQKTADINEYNDQFNNFNNIVGISLKKSENGALHGSAGLTTIEQLIDAKSKNFSKCVGVGNYGNKDGKEFLKEYIKDIQLLKTHCGKVVCYIDKTKNTLEDTMNSLTTDKGWKKCYMDLLDFLLKYRNGLDSAMTYIYNFANSTVDFSAPHYKVMGKNVVKVEPKMKNVEVVGIHIPLSDVRFIWLELNVDGEKKWMKGRPKNKGTKPQFMIDNAGMKTSGYKIVEGL